MKLFPDFCLAAIRNTTTSTNLHNKQVVPLLFFTSLQSLVVFFQSSYLQLLHHMNWLGGIKMNLNGVVSMWKVWIIYIYSSFYHLHLDCVFLFPQNLPNYVCIAISPQNIVWRYIVMQLSCHFQNIVKISISYFFGKFYTILIMRYALWIAFNLPLKLRSLDSLHL